MFNDFFSQQFELDFYNLRDIDIDIDENTVIEHIQQNIFDDMFITHDRQENENLLIDFMRNTMDNNIAAIDDNESSIIDINEDYLIIETDESNIDESDESDIDVTDEYITDGTDNMVIDLTDDTDDEDQTKKT
ncbi:unnamed protein product [Rotaria magnacalcarata]